VDTPRVRLGLLREPALLILLLALVAMVRREYAPDIALVAGTAALVVVDARRWRFRTASARPAAPAAHRVEVAVLLAGVALAMAALPRRSGWTDVAFAVVGLAVLGVAWLPDRVPSVGPGSVVATPTRWWAWPALGVLLALEELYSFLRQPAPMVDSPDHPTISTLVEPALATWPIRALVIWGWLLAG